MKKWLEEDYKFTITVLSVGSSHFLRGDNSAGCCRAGFEAGDEFVCRYNCPADFCSKTMSKLYTLCDVVREEGDLRLLGGNDRRGIKFSCSDGPVMFNLKARELIT